jgi:hypothetical protein
MKVKTFKVTVKVIIKNDVRLRLRLTFSLAWFVLAKLGSSTPSLAQLGFSLWLGLLAISSAGLSVILQRFAWLTFTPLGLDHHDSAWLGLLLLDTPWLG